MQKDAYEKDLFRRWSSCGVRLRKQDHHEIECQCKRCWLHLPSVPGKIQAGSDPDYLHKQPTPQVSIVASELNLGTRDTFRHISLQSEGTSRFALTRKDSVRPKYCCRATASALTHQRARQAGHFDTGLLTSNKRDRNITIGFRAGARFSNNSFSS